MSESRGMWEAAGRDGNHGDDGQRVAPQRKRSAIMRNRAAALALTMLVAACATRPPATAFDRPVTHALPDSAATRSRPRSGR